jgi:HSP20 family protein
MVNLFKRNTKKAEGTPEAAVPADEAQPADLAEATPVAAASVPEAATRGPADTTFWSYASGADEFIQVQENWQDGALVVRAELPGTDPDNDVRLTVIDGYLVIEAARHQEDKVERDGYVLDEQRYSTFTRALPLRDDVDASAISGVYKDGVLEGRIPMPARPPTSPAVRIPITR